MFIDTLRLRYRCCCVNRDAAIAPQLCMVASSIRYARRAGVSQQGIAPISSVLPNAHACRLGEGFGLVGGSLKADRELVLKAMEENPASLKYARSAGGIIMSLHG